MRSRHSDLVLNFRFNIAQVVRVFLSYFTLIITPIIAILDSAGSRFGDIFRILLRRMLHHYNLFRLVLISLEIFLAFCVASIVLLVKNLQIYNLILDLPP